MIIFKNDFEKYLSDCRAQKECFNSSPLIQRGDENCPFFQHRLGYKIFPDLPKFRYLGKNPKLDKVAALDGLNIR